MAKRQICRKVDGTEHCITVEDHTDHSNEELTDEQWEEIAADIQQELSDKFFVKFSGMDFSKIQKSVSGGKDLSQRTLVMVATQIVGGVIGAVGDKQLRDAWKSVTSIVISSAKSSPSGAGASICASLACRNTGQMTVYQKAFRSDYKNAWGNGGFLRTLTHEALHVHDSMSTTSVVVYPTTITRNLRQRQLNCLKNLDLGINQ